MGFLSLLLNPAVIVVSGRWANSVAHITREWLNRDRIANNAAILLPTTVALGAILGTTPLRMLVRSAAENRPIIRLWARRPVGCKIPPNPATLAFVFCELWVGVYPVSGPRVARRLRFSRALFVKVSLSSLQWTVCASDVEDHGLETQD